MKKRAMQKKVVNFKEFQIKCEQLKQIRAIYEKLSNTSYKVKEIMDFITIGNNVLVFDIFDLDNKNDIIEHLKKGFPISLYKPQKNTIIRELDYIKASDVKESDMGNYEPLTKEHKQMIIEFLENY